MSACSLTSLALFSTYYGPFGVRARLVDHAYKEMVSPYGGHTTCRRSSAIKSVAKKATLVLRDTSLTKLFSSLLTF
jgi:hypothetical protein